MRRVMSEGAECLTKTNLRLPFFQNSLYFLCASMIFLKSFEIENLLKDLHTGSLQSALYRLNNLSMT